MQGAGGSLIITGKPLALKRNGQAVDLLWLLDDAVYDRSVRWLPPKCQTGRSDGRRVYSYDFKPAMNYWFWKTSQISSEIGAEFGFLPVSTKMKPFVAFANICVG